MPEIDLNKIKTAAENDFAGASNLALLEEARINHLGRKSLLSQYLRSLKDLPETERAPAGQLANNIRGDLEKAFLQKKENLSKGDIESKLAGQAVDVTAPGRKLEKGHLHPLTMVRREIEQIFSSLGFGVVEGPEIESEWYNFDALNIPVDHPARDMQDTFWLKQDPKDAANPRKHLLPRTQTSAMQVRYMEQHQPPFRIIVPGKVFRNEATDATHEAQFFQVEGLMVDKNISLANLKGVMEYVFSRFFKDKIQVKMVSSYFPFTEPSVEICIRGTKGKLKGRWIEVVPGGMVHQNVFKAAGYVPRQWQGFAFGMGLDRMAMLKYGIDDIRLFYGNDIRFLDQF